MQSPTVSGQQVIEMILSAMKQAKHPLGEGIYLIPAYYKLLLASPVFDELQPIFEYIKTETRRRLDRELALWNKTALKRPILGWVERNLFGKTHEDLPFKRVEPFWTLIFEENLDAGAPLNEVSIEVQFSTPKTNLKPKGLAEAPDLKTRQVYTYAYHFATDQQAHYGTLYYEPKGATPQPFPIYKPEMSIGRRLDENGQAFADLLIGEDPRLSRIHANLRYDLMYKHLEIQDLSRMGTKVNGRLLAPQTWMRLQNGDLISFGDAITLRLETAS